MNYYIEKHDMNIILDALEMLHNEMIACPKEEFNWPYSIEDINRIFQSLENSFVENN